MMQRVGFSPWPVEEGMSVWLAPKSGPANDSFEQAQVYALFGRNLTRE